MTYLPYYNTRHEKLQSEEAYMLQAAAVQALPAEECSIHLA